MAFRQQETIWEGPKISNANSRGEAVEGCRGEDNRCVLGKFVESSRPTSTKNDLIQISDSLQTVLI